VSAPATGGAGRFRGAPSLEGQLVFEGPVRDAAGVDAGGLVSRPPAAVLRPGSIDDVARMIRFCGERRIPVVARGQGHTTFGQAQVQDGLVVDMRALDQVDELDDGQVVVEAGASWRRVLQATLPRQRTPPVLTGYQGLTVGGTLSVGGLSGVSCSRGAQVDHVVELEVVNGEGRVVRCSAERERDLFDAVLAGGGRCGIIVRATLALTRAPRRVRQAVLRHGEWSPFLAAMGRLAREGAVDGVSGTITLAVDRAPRYEIGALTFFGGDGFPEAAPPVAPGGPGASVEVRELDYLDYYLTVDRLLESLEAEGGWKGVMHPWLDVFLPEAQVDAFVAETLATLDPRVDVGPPELGALGQVHLYPVWSRALRRPLLRVPDSPLVFLFDILTAAHAAGHDPRYATRMLERNQRIFEAARACGGTPYGICAVPLGREAWLQQLGPARGVFEAAKRAHDPHDIFGSR